MLTLLVFTSFPRFCAFFNKSKNPFPTSCGSIGGVNNFVAIVVDDDGDEGDTVELSTSLLFSVLLLPLFCIHCGGLADCGGVHNIPPFPFFDILLLLLLLSLLLLLLLLLLPSLLL